MHASRFVFSFSRRLGVAIGFAGLLPLAVSANEAPAPASEWRLDFEAATPGSFALAQLKQLSPAPVLWAEGFASETETGRCSIVETARSRRALEVLYPAGAVGPRVGGAQWMAQLPPRDSYALEYRVRFAADFEWVRGGKLPGLAGGATPSGGFFNPDGFTSRYMWRPEGRLVVYLYWAGQPSAANGTGVQYGEDLDLGVTLERGREYVLRQRVTLNTPGKPDGRLEVWVDGRLVLDRGDLLFRNEPGKTWQIDRFFFSTFHGGNDPSWAPSRDVTVRFDDFHVWP